MAGAPAGKRSPPLLAEPMLRRNRELGIDDDAPSYWCHGAPVDWFRPGPSSSSMPALISSLGNRRSPGPDGFWPTSLLREDAAGDETRFGKQGPAILWYRRLPSYQTTQRRHQPINTDGPGSDADVPAMPPLIK